MKSISRHYIQICKQKYQPLGFSNVKSITTKTTFVRIRGDIIQAFALKRSKYVPTCTVEFGILPLCMPQPIYLDAGGYELNRFTVERLYSEWEFDPKSNESIEKCIELVSEAIDQYLMPFFYRCTDCNSAFSELIKLEELFECNRRKMLQLKGLSDRSVLSWQERLLFDSRMYYMALKTHNFSYARHYLQYQVDFHDRRLKEFDAPDAPRQPDIVKERFVAARVLYAELLERLNSGDIAYFEGLINSNESQMRRFIADNYPQI